MDRTVCFLVLPHVHLLDLSGPVQVFYEASRFGPGNYNIRYCGMRKQETSEQGLELAGLTPIDEMKLNEGDFIFVPGIDFAAFDKGAFKRDVSAMRPWLHQQSANSVNVASICSGSLILADAGLLNNRKATSHWKCIEFMRKRYPKINVQTDLLFVKDGNLFTSAGMTSGIDMALSIVEHHHGPIVAAKVAREIVVYMRRNHDDKQQTIYLDYKTHFDPAVHRVQDYIISHPAKNATLSELAAIANLSVRSLTRAFKKATGHTLIEFKNAVRIELVRTLLHSKDLTIDNIASRCGFNDARQLRRIWKDQVGTSLSSERTKQQKGLL